MGNPGSGKSLLLNSIIGEPLFNAGFSPGLSSAAEVLLLLLLSRFRSSLLGLICVSKAGASSEKQAKDPALGAPMRKVCGQMAPRITSQNCNPPDLLQESLGPFGPGVSPKTGVSEGVSDGVSPGPEGPGS